MVLANQPKYLTLHFFIQIIFHQTVLTCTLGSQLADKTVDILCLAAQFHRLTTASRSNKKYINL